MSCKEGEYSMKILANAAEKIKKFNNSPDAPRESYHRVLKTRAGANSVIDHHGSVSNEHLIMVDKALRSYFGMNRGKRMGSTGQFVSNLSNKLADNKARNTLATLRGVTAISPNLDGYKSDAQELYESLSNRENGLSADGTYFCVGTTKVMHCVLPELFVMLDGVAAKGIRKCYLLQSNYNNFKSYWKVMKICRDELLEWQRLYGNIKSLLNLDPEPTSLTRIFDKCAIVTALWGR